MTEESAITAAEEAVKAYEELVTFLVSPILGEEEFKIKARVRHSTLQIELRAPSHVRGRVIGRGGRVARSLRTIIESAAIPAPFSVSFDIAD